jgi:hypothetical protein
MMPQLITVRVRPAHSRGFRLWVPVLPVLLLLSPLLVLAALVAVVVCVAYRVDPVRALAAVWRLLCATRGTHIDVEDGKTAVLVSIT